MMSIFVNLVLTLAVLYVVSPTIRNDLNTVPGIKPIVDTVVGWFKTEEKK